MLESRVIVDWADNCINALLFNPLGHVHLEFDFVNKDFIDFIPTILFEAIHGHGESLAG